MKQHLVSGFQLLLLLAGAGCSVYDRKVTKGPDGGMVRVIRHTTKPTTFGKSALLVFVSKPGFGETLAANIDPAHEVTAVNWLSKDMLRIDISVGRPFPPKPLSLPPNTRVLRKASAVTLVYRLCFRADGGEPACEELPANLAE